MSRRDDRDSHAKRHYYHHSLSERDRSPKRSRRDGKLATERTHSSNQNLETDGSTDQKHKHRKRLQHALPFEVPLPPDSKVKQDIPTTDSDRKIDGLSTGIKHASDPKEVPRSQSYFEHDVRGNAGQGRNHSHRTSDHGKWNDYKDHSSAQIKDKAERADLHKTDVRTRTHGNDNRAWKHDGFFELEAEVPPAPPIRKRPPFTEEKPVKPDSAGATGIQPKDHHNQPVQGGQKREEKHHSRGVDNPEKPFSHVDERNGRSERFPVRNDMHRSAYHSRNRYGSWYTRGRESSGGRYGDRSTNQRGHFQVEKWKHDLFDETNRSPSPKNEEEQIAKIEALLAL